MGTGHPKIAVVIPCFNEAPTVEKVVRDFRGELPDADIYVYDNNSTDGTAEAARRAGAIVRREFRQGKGHVVRAMFRDVLADIYVMADGDDTYPAASVHRLIQPVLADEAEVVVGARQARSDHKAFRRFHVFGNALVVKLINILFGSKLVDAMSGYRVFSRRFAKTVPIMSAGFEIETEMTISALDKGFIIKEIPVPYGERPPGSFSKLNTFRDGALVIQTILRIFRDYRPLLFFSLLGALSAVSGLAVGIPVVIEFFETGRIEKIPSAILASGLGLLGMLQVGIGLILDTQAWLHRETYQNFRALYEILEERRDR